MKRSVSQAVMDQARGDPLGYQREKAWDEHCAQHEEARVVYVVEEQVDDGEDSTFEPLAFATEALAKQYQSVLPKHLSFFTSVLPIHDEDDMEDLLKETAEEAQKLEAAEHHRLWGTPPYRLIAFYTTEEMYKFDKREELAGTHQHWNDAVDRAEDLLKVNEAIKSVGIFDSLSFRRTEIHRRFRSRRQ